MKTVRIITVDRYNKLLQQVVTDVGVVELVSGIETEVHILKTNCIGYHETENAKKEVREAIKNVGHKVL